jgi:hypothetical protein
MAETCYPVFQEGQTLTRDDLNRLHAFLDDRTRLLGRAVGFGINCGLEGEIAGATLRIDAGLALDQHGEVLPLEDEATIALPPTPAATAFEFVAGTDGFTPVLVTSEKEIPAPECDEEGCEAHAGVLCRTATIVVVRGRLTRAREFADEPLLGETPLRIRKTNAVEGSFVKLRDAIEKRLKGVLSAETRAKLAALTIENDDLPAIKAYKAAFLNQLLFAALDYLRCASLMDAACLRETPTPGVALGWLHQVGGAWRWECEDRHGWEPPAGLSLALVGGDCADPCQFYIDRLEGLITTFKLPPAPKADDPPKDEGTEEGDYTVCEAFDRTKGGAYLLQLEACGFHVYAPELLPENWTHVFIDKGDPPWDGGFTDPADPWVIYAIDEPEVVRGGKLIDLGASFGAEANGAAGAIRTIVENADVTADVRVVKATQVDNVKGLKAAGVVSPSDTIVLIADGHGKVVGTGHIPAQVGMRNVGTSVGVARDVLKKTTELQGKVQNQETAVVTLAGQVLEMAETQGGLVRWQGETARTLGTLDTAIAHEGERVLSAYQATIGPMLDGALGEAVSNVKADLVETARNEIKVSTGGLTERMSKLEGKVETGQREALRTGERIDQMLSARAVGLTTETTKRNVELNQSLVEVLGTTRRTIEMTANPRTAPQVKAELARADEAYARLEGQARAGSLLVADEGAAISTVVESMVAALGAAGAPAPELERLRTSAKGLQERLR